MKKYKVIDNIKGWAGNVRFYLIITIIFFAVTIICFTWNIWDTFSYQLPINHEVWGQFGDFVGAL